MSYTGNGVAGATVGHGLDSEPELIIPKNRDEAQSWVVGASAIGKSYILDLANPNARLSRPNQYYYDWNSTTITMGSQVHTNGLNDKIIAYCFHSIDGYQKVGSYQGNTSTLPSVDLGFSPRFVMIKSATSTSNWTMWDNVRPPDPATQNNYILNANLSNSEAVSSGNILNFTSTGFNIEAGGGAINSNSQTYIYLAIA